MGATFVHGRQQVQPCDHFTVVFEAVYAQLSFYPQFCFVSWPPTIHGSIGTLQGPRNQGIPIGRKGDGHRFLRFARWYLHRLQGVGQNSHRALQCRIITSILRRIPGKRRRSAKEKSSTKFSTFDPVRLLFVSKLENVFRQGILSENVFFRRVEVIGASVG